MPFILVLFRGQIFFNEAWNMYSYFACKILFLIMTRKRQSFIIFSLETTLHFTEYSDRIDDFPNLQPIHEIPRTQF